MRQQYKIMSAHKEMRGLEYLLYSALSLSLLIVLVFLPLAPVFADELITETADSTLETPPQDDVTLEENEVTTESEVIADIPSTDTQPPAPASEAETVADDVLPIDTSAQTADTTGAETSDTPVDISDETTTTDEELIGEDGDTTLVPPTDATTSDGIVTEEPLAEVVVTEDEIIEVPDAVVDEPSIEIATEEATATPETIVENVVSAITNDDNKFTFSKNDCTTVGDGTFYCATPTEKPQVQHTDRIFSALDEEGDKEIFVEKEGELSALTKNQADDDAPYYDEVSDTAVWQRLIDGRYQIIQYDFDEESEKQLTYDSFNNMQPSVFGGTVVWQGWVGSDWEIFMSVDQKVTMLTDNTIHDIAPSVNGTHIVWQSFEGDVWQMKVYDLRTGLTNTIEDAGGGSIENPRFVLVYDAKMETGDIETRGYDLKSGEVRDLASKPTSLPEEIPDPDQTGEDRALVSPTTQPKQKVDSDENDDVGTTTDNGIDDGDIVIPSFELPSDEPVITDATTTPESSNDIHLPAFEGSATSTDTAHIEDLVVEPYVSLEEVLEEEVQN